MAPKSPKKEPDRRYFLSRLLGRPPKPRTYATILDKIANLLRVHYKGVFGILVPIAAFSWRVERFNQELKLKMIWLTMLWFFFIRPVDPVVTALIPIYAFPLTGAQSSARTASCYTNEHIFLMLLGSMVAMLLNNSGVDRRIALAVMSAGSPRSFSAKMLVYKCSSVAFFLGMFSNRLISSAMITEYATKALSSCEARFGKDKAECNLKEVRYIVNNAIQTSSGIGSITIIHASFATLSFRSMFTDGQPDSVMFTDLFNYLQYTTFAFPIALIMFIINLFYHMYLVNLQSGKEMSNDAKVLIHKAIITNKAQLPKDMSTHEKLSIVFVVISLFFFIYRWSLWRISGWANFELTKESTDEFKMPAISDATVAAIFVVLLHSLPTSTRFLKYFSARTRAELPPCKAESSVLWWRFLDKNINYAYFFFMGAGNAILRACRKGDLGDIIAEHLGTHITGAGWLMGTLIVCLIASILPNLITANAACIMFLPFVLCAASNSSAIPWPTHGFMAVMAVGIASNFGFMVPFLYTPGYFCYHVGKVPRIKMAKYSVFTVIVCFLVLWLAINFYAPWLWEPDRPDLRFEVTSRKPGEGPPTEEAGGRI